MAVLFDIRGNLQAKPFIQLSQPEIEQVFVKPFSNDSSRYSLFEEYKRYTEHLRQLIDSPFYQWINGSFVSNTHNPNDIDLISFINYEVYLDKEQAIDERFSKRSVNRYYVGIDAFTVWVYPDGHKCTTLFLAHCAYWYDWFGHTRYNRNRKRFAKGFIQVTID